MNLILDTHSHTIASGHAYSTISEMAQAAKEKGLELLAITDHGMALPGACHEFYFHNIRVVPRNQFGVELLLGAEANIISFQGNLDMNRYTLSCVDLVIASLHNPCLEPGTYAQNTNAYLGAMKNPAVHIIGHPDDARYPVDYEALVKAAKDSHVLLEINNSSLHPQSFREHARENDIQLLTLCKQYEVMITLGSDAHVANDVGNFTYAKELLSLTEFPESLIINTSSSLFKSWLQDHKELKK